MIKCIIVEDEALARDVIISHLKQTAQLELVGICCNALEAIEALSQKDVDVIFLDIRLPGMTGLNLLRTLINPPLIILTTAYADYALESYEFNVIDYLLKPISFERFAKAISKLTDGRLFEGSVTNRQPVLTDHFFIKSGNKFFKIDFREIIYIEGMKDYLKIHTPEYRLITHQTMVEMEKILPAKNFIRVHKSYIISIAYIRSIYGNFIEMEKATIPIGSSYKDKVMNFIGRRN